MSSFLTPARRAACVLLVRDEHVLMVTTRGSLTEWGFPGGRLEDGETPAKAAARELREETGIDVAPEGLLLLYRGDCVGWDCTTLWCPPAVSSAANPPAGKGQDDNYVAWLPWPYIFALEGRYTDYNRRVKDAWDRIMMLRNG